MCIFCERAQSELAGGLSAAQKLEAERCEQLREVRVRATILTGFLGAGKTTFLNFVLKSQGHGQRIGVVQNEFGSVSVDDELMLVERSDTEVVVMPNGCLCCRVRGDLVDALHRMAGRSLAAVASDVGAADSAAATPQLDGLIIECSGLSEVMPVAQTFFADPFVQAAFQLDGVICVCDAGNFEALEGGAAGAEGSQGVGRLLREQLGISDVCLLNKCDQVTSARRDSIATRIREVSPAIRVVPCRHGKVNLGQVMKIKSFSLDSVLSLDAHFLDGTAELPVPPIGSGRGLGLVRAFGGNSRGDLAQGHTHAGFGSLGLELEGEVDLDALKVWLRGVVEKHGDALVRIKGVLRTTTSGARTIVQGVGGHVEIGEESASAEGGGRSAGSRLVLIGRLLDSALRAELAAGFEATAVAFVKAAPVVETAARI